MKFLSDHFFADGFSQAHVVLRILVLGLFFGAVSVQVADAQQATLTGVVQTPNGK